MEARNALREISTRFKIPHSVIAEYAGVDRKTVKRYLDGDTNSKETEAKILEGLRQISTEINALCYDGPVEDEEWED